MSGAMPGALQTHRSPGYRATETTFQYTVLLLIIDHLDGPVYIGHNCTPPCQSPSHFARILFNCQIKETAWQKPIIITERHIQSYAVRASVAFK